MCGSESMCSDCYLVAFGKGVREVKIEIKDDLKVVLDFIERWNKNDAEVEVANSASRLEKLFS